MKRMKRMLAYLLVIATVFAFTPFIGSEVYATDYENQAWLYDTLTGLHGGKAVAGSRVACFTYEVADELNISLSQMSSAMGYFQYEDSSGSVRTLTSGYLDSEWHDCTIPSDATSDCSLWLEIHAKGNKYRTKHIPCAPAVVSSDIMKDKGEVTINLKGKGFEYGLMSSTIDQEALRNSLNILNSNGKISIYEVPDAPYWYYDACDFDYDWMDDLVFITTDDASYEMDYGYDTILALTDWKEDGVYQRVKSVSAGMDLSYCVSYLKHYDERNAKFPYYSKITIKFPANLKKATVSLSSTSLVYTGKARQPVPTVKYNGTKLTKDGSYKVSGSRATIGPGTVTITGMGRYTGTVKKSFTVVPGKVTIKSITGGTKQLTVKWGKKSGGVRYQVKYRVKGTSTWSNTTAGTSTSKTIKNLKKGKTYEVKVRAYKTVGGKNYYGAFSAVKTVKVK